MPLGITIAIVLAQATTPPAWTLDDAVAAFLLWSPELEEARARDRAAHADVVQAGLASNPEASVTLGNVPLRANVTGSGNGPGISRNLVTSIALGRAFALGEEREKRVAVATSRAAATRTSFEDVLRLAPFDLERAFWFVPPGRIGEQFGEHDSNP